MYPIEDEQFDLVTQPILFINSETFEFDRNLNKMKELLIPTHSSDRRNPSAFDEIRKAVTIKRSTHFNYCDVPFITNWFARRMFCANSKISPFSVQDLACATMLVFMNKHLGKFI